MAFRMHHTTSHSCCSLSSFSLNVCERIGSSSFLFSLVTSLRKSFLLHIMLFGCAFYAATSSSTSCQIITITFLVQAGIDSFSRSPSLHTFGRPWRQFHWTSQIQLCTSTVPSYMLRKRSFTSSLRRSLSNSPPESTNASFLLSLFPNTFLRITVSTQQSPSGWTSMHPLRLRSVCSERNALAEPLPSLLAAQQSAQRSLVHAFPSSGWDTKWKKQCKPYENMLTSITRLNAR